MYRRTLAAFALPLLLAAAGARAQTATPAPEAGPWGAVTVGPEASQGAAVSQASEETAQKLAKEACAGNCTRGYSFQGGCGAIAMAGELAFAGAGATQAQAERQALGYCQGEYMIDCAVRISACNE